MKVSKLKPKNRNPRKIDQPAIDRLKASITDFPAMMELRPIVYDPETMEVIGGNQRLAAIKSMGMKEIPDTWAISAEKLTPDEKKRFVLQDNHQSGDWDFDILTDDFGDMLDEIGIDLPEIEKEYEPSRTKEIDTNTKFEHICPKCGFEFNE